jgi:hypothetical protein
MKNPSKNGSPPPNRERELRSELARKIASFIGTKEKLITDVPGLLLDQWRPKLKEPGSRQ